MLTYHRSSFSWLSSQQLLGYHLRLAFRLAVRAERIPPDTLDRGLHRSLVAPLPIAGQPGRYA